MCPALELIVGNILNNVDDTNNTIYSSGQVLNSVLANVPILNGLMGSCYSGDYSSGCISPNISGTVYQAILELYVAKELTKKRLYGLSRQYNLTSFTEGDSKVTVADSTKYLADLYKILGDEFNRILNQTKYTLASNGVASVIGTDGNLDTSLPYLPYVNYRPMLI